MAVFELTDPERDSPIVLACAEGLNHEQVAAPERVQAHTVSKWRRRFVEFRLGGLSDDARPGRH
jgi:transposase